MVVEVLLRFRKESQSFTKEFTGRRSKPCHRQNAGNGGKRIHPNLFCSGRMFRQPVLSNHPVKYDRLRPVFFQQARLFRQNSREGE